MHSVGVRNFWPHRASCCVLFRTRSWRCYFFSPGSFSWLGKTSHEKMHTAPSGKGLIGGQAMLRGREDDLQHCLLQRNQTRSNSCWAQEDCLSQPPWLLRRNQGMALPLEYGQKCCVPPQSWSLETIGSHFLFLSPIGAKTKHMSISHTTQSQIVL